MRYLVTGLVAFLGYNFFIPIQEPALVFVKSLSPEQRLMALFPFEDEKRKDWHYLPAASYERSGIRLDQLHEDQKTKVHNLIKSVLSRKGYHKTTDIIDLENILAELENNDRYRDPDQYAIAIFGEPGDEEGWGWSFSGHHISLHFTYLDGKLSTTPRFLGANPGNVQSGPKMGERVLGMEEDLGFDLLRSLDPAQYGKAVISEEPYFEILTRNASEVSPLEKKGILLNELNSQQKVIFWNLLDEYLSTLQRPLAQERKLQLVGEEILFAWAGATTIGEPHYYRIQGESFLIEFDNAQNEANHVHTVWRDFDGDFGKDLIREHRVSHSH